MSARAFVVPANECPDCGGEGRVWVVTRGCAPMIDPPTYEDDCSTCDGSGVVEIDPDDLPEVAPETLS